MKLLWWIILTRQVDNVKLGVDGWKVRYYNEKFGAKCDRDHVAKCYVEGLVWVLKYYYQVSRAWACYY